MNSILRAAHSKVPPELWESKQSFKILQIESELESNLPNLSDKYSGLTYYIKFFTAMINWTFYTFEQNIFKFNLFLH